MTIPLGVTNVLSFLTAGNFRKYVPFSYKMGVFAGALCGGRMYGDYNDDIDAE
jgi:hypothetical protein